MRSTWRVPGKGLVRRPGDFPLLWTSSTVSQLGTAVTSVALPLAAVLRLHATTFQVGLLTAAGTVAWLLFGLVSGVWVDRLPYRPLLVTCDLVRAAALLCVPLAAAAGELTMGELVAVAFIVGVASVFFDVAVQAYMPAIVEKDRLLSANSRLTGGVEGARIGGPAVGGVLVQAFGAPAALVADVVSYVISALLLRGARRAAVAREAPGPSARGQLAQVREGLGFVWGNQVLRPLALTAASLNLCSSGILALQVPFLVHSIHLRPGIVGALIATDAIGAVLGAMVVTRLAAWLGSGKTVAVAVTAGPVLSLLVPLTARGPALVLFAAGTAGLATFTVVFSVMARVYRQTVAPARLLGRVTAVNRFISWGVMPVGALLAGALGQAIGNRGGLWVISGMLVIMTPLPLLLSPVRRTRDLASVPAPSEPAAVPHAGGQAPAMEGTADPTQAAAGTPLTRREEER
jgi:MFS family permease